MKTLNPDNWIAGDEMDSEVLRKPLVFGGYKFWSNGRVMIGEVTRDADDCSGDFERERVAKILFDQAGEAADLVFEHVKVDIGIEKNRCRTCGGGGKHRLATCRECKGDGDVTAKTDYNSYEVQCASCDGKGKEHREDAQEQQCSDCNGGGWVFPPYEPFYVLSAPVAVRYIAMVRHIPDIQYAASGKKLFWKSEAEQCFGAIMRLNI